MTYRADRRRCRSGVKTRPRLALIILILVALLLVPSGSSALAAAKSVSFGGLHLGRYHALVIGNNNYQHLNKLKTAANDAEAVANVLRHDYGFDVTLQVNTTRAEILGALAGYRKTLKPNDNLLIYYAGHGIVDSITDEGFLLPVDAEEDVPTNWISNADVTNMLKAIRAKHVMVVSDSCYSGTLVRAADAELKTSEEDAAWMKRISRKRSRTALASGSLEPVLDGGGGDHSIFAKAFLGALRANDAVLDGQTLFRNIRGPIALEADQTPRYADIRRAGHEGGDFLLVAVNRAGTGATQPAQQSTAGASSDDSSSEQLEMVFWNSIKDSDNAADFEAYLGKFPRGTFAALARNRIKAMQKTRSATVARVTDPRARFNGTWKWRVSLSGECDGAQTRSMTIKDGKIKAQITHPYVGVVSFSGFVLDDGKASVRMGGAANGNGRGEFTETEAKGSIDLAHPDGSCSGTWVANRVSTN